MEIGDSLEGYTIQALLPGSKTTRRALAQSAEGEPVELLWPEPASADNLRSFRELHGAARTAGFPTLHLLGSPERPVAIRAPLDPSTLSDLTPPLDPAVVAAIGSALLPALNDRALPHGLGRTDFGISTTGEPVLAPLGTLSPGFKHPPSTVLASLLFWLATGQDGPPTPVGMDRAALVPELRAPIEHLLQSDGVAAQRALEHAAGSLPDLREHVAAPAPDQAPSSRVGEVKLTTGDSPGASRSRRDTRPRQLVVLPASAAQALPPAERSRLAGELQIDKARLDRAIASGASISLPQTAATASLKGAVSRGAPGWSLIVLGTLLLLTTLIALPSSAAISLVLSPLVALLGGALSGIVGIAGLAVLAVGIVQRVGYGRQLTSWSELSGTTEPHPLTQELRQTLFAARRELAAADLPDIAERDLRLSIDEVEALLPDLERSYDHSEPDRDALRAEVRALRAGVEEIGTSARQPSSSETVQTVDRARRALSSAQRSLSALRATGEPRS